MEDNQLANWVNKHNFCRQVAFQLNCWRATPFGCWKLGFWLVKQVKVDNKFDILTDRYYTILRKVLIPETRSCIRMGDKMGAKEVSRKKFKHESFWFKYLLTCCSATVAETGLMLLIWYTVFQELTQFVLLVHGWN